MASANLHVRVPTGCVATNNYQRKSSNILYKRLCDSYNILYENQGAFLKNHSTISTVALFTDNLYKAINDTNISIATFINFSKAFDTFNHNILLQKLDHIGMNVNSKLLIENYLSA